MILTKEVTVDNFYRTYYTALNGILNLTKKQLDVLVELSDIRSKMSDAFTDDQKDEYTFSFSTKEIICEKLSITIFNLNNLLKALRDKGFIINKGEGYSLNPFLYKKMNEDLEVVFKFKIK